MIGCETQSAHQAGVPPVRVRLRVLTRIVPVVAVWAGCLGSGADLNRGDAPPISMRSGGRPTIVLAASLEDCLSCDLRGVFAALRALQGMRTEGLGPEIVLLAVIDNRRDTLFFRQTLNRERVDGRIELIAPSAARKIFDENLLPAMYLIEDGRVAQEWESASGQQGRVSIGRSELVDVMTERDQP